MQKIKSAYQHLLLNCLRTSLMLTLLILCCMKAFAYPNPAQDPFKIKAFHIDLRVQVMKMPALKKLITHLHDKGINTVIMEWEGAYPYKEETIIANRFAYKRSEIKEFINYCHGLDMDVIPLQQTFGHVEYILRNYKYAALREDSRDFSQTCPSELDLCKKLFTNLIKDLIETHHSPYVHVGGDETFLLGHCAKCQKKAAELGLSRLYFDYIQMICNVVVGLGKKPVIWADIALKYPDYIHLLPKETIFIDWNYGWDLSRFGDHEKLLNSGYEIWGAPALRSEPDNFFLTKWEKHFNNIQTFIPQIRALHYSGVVMTAWSTSGSYSTVFDSNNDPVALYPVRRVYPITGFNLLIDAYTTAIKTDQPLNVPDFINAYCMQQYGFTKEKATLFKKALFMTPETVVQGQVQAAGSMSLSSLIDSAAQSVSIFQRLNPQKNAAEFKQYILMAGIRLFYLKVLKLEAELNSGTYNADATDKYKLALAPLRKMSVQLNAEFEALNGSTLYPAEIMEENNLRNAKLNFLDTKLRNDK